MGKSGPDGLNRKMQIKIYLKTWQSESSSDETVGENGVSMLTPTLTFVVATNLLFLCTPNLHVDRQRNPFKHYTENFSYNEEACCCSAHC